jgi:flagellar protein FliO/FliZ
MVVKLVLSLGFVAGVLWFAARVAKKKGLGQAGGLIEVVARQRMGRSSSVTVMRIADRVLVVGATEEQVTLLTEVDGDVVETILAEHRATLPAAPGGDGSDGSDGTPADGVPSPRRPARVARPAGGALSGSVLDRSAWGSLMSELREKTVRR